MNNQLPAAEATHRMQTRENIPGLSPDDTPASADGFPLTPTVTLGEDKTGSGVTVEVALPTPLPRAASFSYRTVDGTAKVFEDYQPINNRYGLPAGATNLPFLIGLRDDLAIEGNEEFFVEYIDEDGVYVPAGQVVARVRMVIADNDKQPATISGTAGNDTLTLESQLGRLDGLGGDDTLTGNAFGDTLSGGAGNDLLDGGNDFSADLLEGGDGDDTFVMGMGGDTIRGGAGIDTIRIPQGDISSPFHQGEATIGGGVITVAGFASVTASGMDRVFYDGKGRYDTLTLRHDAGRVEATEIEWLTLDFKGASSGVSITTQANGGVRVDGGGTQADFSGLRVLSVNGSDKGDTIDLRAFATTLITTGAGDDLLQLGNSRSYITWGGGNDTIQGGTSTGDLLEADLGKHLNGSLNMTLDKGVITEARGTRITTTGFENFWITGGAGNDRIELKDLSGLGVIEGVQVGTGGGIDTIVISDPGSITGRVSLGGTGNAILRIDLPSSTVLSNAAAAQAFLYEQRIATPGGGNIQFGGAASQVVFSDRTISAADIPIIVRIAEASRNLTVTEGDGGSKVVNVTIELDRVSASDVTVRVTAPGGQAQPGQDYAVLDQEVRIAAGSKSVTVPLTVLGDRAIERDEVITVQLSNARGALAAAPGDADGRARITVFDDDPIAARPVLLVSDGSKLLAYSPGFAGVPPKQVATLNPNVTTTLPGLADIDNDGRQEVLFLNGSDLVSWNAELYSAGFTQRGTVFDQIVGIGNLRAGAGDDLLVQSKAGDLRILDFEGATTRSTYLLKMGEGTRVAGVGQIDGTGPEEIIFQEQANKGHVFAWTGSDWTTLITPGADWSVERVDDFVGDGKADLLLRNDATGARVVWDVSRGSDGFTAFPQLVSPWTVVATGDLTGDGKAEVVVRNGNDGSAAYWNFASPGWTFFGPIGPDVVGVGYPGGLIDELSLR